MRRVKREFLEPRPQRTFAAGVDLTVAIVAIVAVVTAVAMAEKEVAKEVAKEAVAPVRSVRV